MHVERLVRHQLQPSLAYASDVLIRQGVPFLVYVIRTNDTTSARATSFTAPVASVPDFYNDFTIACL